MSLSSALSTSGASLAALSKETAIVSRNVSNASNADYARKTAKLVTGLDGAAHVAGVSRAVNVALAAAALHVGSAAARDKALSDGYDQLSATLGGTDFGQSPATAIGKLSDALQQLSAAPGTPSLAGTVLSSANALARNLNQASIAVQGVRKQADSDIAASVGRINDLLSQFQGVDTAIVRGGSGDTSDDQDQRDSILSQLSAEIGITTTTRPDGGTAIYTDSGVALYDREPRAISFQETTAFAAGVAGNAVTVDGVDVTTAGGPQAIASGRLVGLATLRDTASVTYQAQLDETAHGLIDAFKESDQGTPATLPDAPGLFTWGGDPALPSAGLTNGLAASIRVNPSVDPARGGDITRIRDGGAANGGDPAYRANAAGAAGFADHLKALTEALKSSRSFAPEAGLSTSASLSAFAEQSIDALEAGRKSANDSATQQGAIRDRAQQALQSDTGVNLDEELSHLLDLEHAYGASSKLISAVDTLFNTLLQAVN